jgi:hypothetical protein
MKGQDSIGHLENEIHFQQGARAEGAVDFAGFHGAAGSRTRAKRLLESTCS